MDAILDQWDLSPGSDIATFMEGGLTSANRVVVVSSESYVAKANEGHGGVGYEKMIVTAELIQDLGSKKFIPIIRGSGTPPVPTFLGYRFYIDFEDDDKYQTSLEMLLREIHGIPDPEKPPIGKNPFDRESDGNVVMSPSEDVQLQPLIERPESRDRTEEFSLKIGRLKQLISEPAHLMKLQELLQPIAAACRSELETSRIADYGTKPTREEFLRRISLSDEATDLLAQLFVVGGHWANREQMEVFVRSLARVALVPSPTGTFYEAWETVARYPALRVFYAGALSAFSGGSFGNLHQLVYDVKSRVRSQEPEAPLLIVLHAGAGFAQRFWKWLPGRDRHHLPVSDYLEESLRPAFEGVIPEDEFELLFDRFEFFQSLVYSDLAGGSSDSDFWAPLGSFAWRRRDLFEEYRTEIGNEGADWKPLRSGFFGGSADRAMKALDRLLEFTSRVRRQLGIW